MPKKSTTKLLSELNTQSTRFKNIKVCIHIGTKIGHTTIIKLISGRGYKQKYWTIGSECENIYIDKNFSEY